LSFLGQKEEPLPLHILFSDFTKQLKQSVNFLITTFHDKSLFQAQHDTLLFQAECSQEVEVVPPVDTIVEKSKSMLNLPPPLSPPALPLSRFWPGRHQLSSLFLCILQLRFFWACVPVVVLNRRCSQNSNACSTTQLQPTPRIRSVASSRHCSRSQPT